MSANIFISFAGQDQKVANTLCKALEGRGFNCWISSRDIQPGENFQSAIVRAIRGARMMLLVFTGNSNNSEEMTKELALASQARLIVVPLRIEDVAPNDAFEYEFATRQWINFFADWEAAMEQLSLRISSALAVETKPPEAKRAPAPAPVQLEAPPAAEEAKPAPVAAPPVAAEPAPAKPAPATPPPAAAPASVAPAPVAAAVTAAAPVAATAVAAPAKAPVAEKPAASPSAKATAPSAKPATPPPAASAAAFETGTPQAKKPAPVALFVGLGVLAAAAVGALLILPSMLAHKAPPASPAPVAPVALKPAPTPAPAPILAPPANAIVAATDASSNAATNTNTIAAAPTPHVSHHRVHQTATSTEVPF